MASLMVNFRVPEEFVKALDASARQAGLDRSAYIRAVLKQAVFSGQEPSSPVVTKDCAHPEEKLRRTTYGIRVCECGARLRS